MEKEHISTYRAGPYIFIEEAKILTDAKGRVFIQAQYRDYNPITMKGMVKARVRTRTFKVDFENHCITYKN